jgi:hypothetical protein
MHCQLPTIALALLLGVCVAEPLSSWRSIDSIKIHTTDAIGRHLAALDPTPADFESRDRSASERFRAALAARRRPRPAAGAANASGATPIARVAPAGLRLAFEFDGRAFVYDLRPVDVFSADAAIVINDGGEEGGEHGDDEPTAAHLSGLPFGGLRTFVARGAGVSGEGWARVVLEDDDSISALVFDPLAFDPADSLFALERRAVARAADEAAHAASGYARLSLEPTSTGAHARRLQTAGTILRARMSGCPPRAHLYTMRIGIVADAGYVAAVGGAAATRKKVAQMVLNTNAIFEQQVGVTFLVDKLVVNLPDVATPFPRSGPNYAPSSPGDRNTCAAPMVGGSSYSSPPHVWSGLTQPNNLVEPGIVAQAHGWMLSELSLWSAAHAPQTSTRGGPLASWHLLTNCFPPPGLVGLANQGSICTKSRRFFFEDTGAPSDPVGAWTYRLPSGNQAIPTSYSDALPCPAGWAPCTAATTLVTYTDDASVNPTWRTFAHESARAMLRAHECRSVPRARSAGAAPAPESQFTSLRPFARLLPSVRPPAPRSGPPLRRGTPAGLDAGRPHVARLADQYVVLRRRHRLRRPRRRARAQRGRRALRLRGVNRRDLRQRPARDGRAVRRRQPQERRRLRPLVRRGGRLALLRGSAPPLALRAHVRQRCRRCQHARGVRRGPRDGDVRRLPAAGRLGMHGQLDVLLERVRETAGRHALPRRRPVQRARPVRDARFCHRGRRQRLRVDVGALRPDLEDQHERVPAARDDGTARVPAAL